MGFWFAYMGMYGGGGAAAPVAYETQRQTLYGTSMERHTLVATTLERHTLRGATP